MARASFHHEESRYYPPRARWYAFIYRLGSVVRRRLATSRMSQLQPMKIGGLIAGFFVPGLAVYLRGARTIGAWLMAACAVLLAVYFAELGQGWANLVFGLLISIHVSGLVFYCSPLIAVDDFGRRMAFTFMLMIALLAVVYIPARVYLQGHWLTPMHVNGKVIVIRRQVASRAIERGNWIAYQLDPGPDYGYQGNGVWLHAGVDLAPVLALAGDQVVFTPKACVINGVAGPKLPHMPNDGGFIVPENHWFVWPNLAISGHGNGSESLITGTMLDVATVSEKQFVGRPFNHWFWHPQHLP